VRRRRNGFELGGPVPESQLAVRAQPSDAPARGPLDRFLGLFTDVRGGEGGTALLLAANVLLLLTAYYMIKPVREAFILQGGSAVLFGWTVGKAELKSYASAGMAALLLLIVPAYGRLASAVPRQRLVTIVSLFFAANLVVFWMLARGPVSAWLAIAFFLWVGIFNMLVVAQFWSFANDVYVPEQGKRLFPILGFGASFGAVAGSWVTGRLIVLGEAQLLLLAALLLGVCVLLTNLVHGRETRRRQARIAAGIPDLAARQADQPVGREGGFKLVFAQRYLLYIALLILLANLVNTTGEFILGKKVAQAAAAAVGGGAAETEGRFIGKFYSDYFLVVNILTAVLQLFVVSRIFKYLGVRVALLLLPLIALGGYAVLAFGAGLGLVRVVKTLENSTDYSVQNTTRNVLFLPTSREAKYKAKAAIDTFFVRIGDFSSALLVYAGTAVAFSVENFAMVNLVLVAVWIGLAFAVMRRYRGLAEPGRP
jgi:AAA family ATP:ADP antiporter